MLYIIHPLAFILCSISKEFTIPMPYILCPVTVIHWAIIPLAYTNSLTPALTIKTTSVLPLVNMDKLYTCLRALSLIHVFLKVKWTLWVDHWVHLDIVIDFHLGDHLLLLEVRHDLLRLVTQCKLRLISVESVDIRSNNRKTNWGFKWLIIDIIHCLP